MLKAISIILLLLTNIAYATDNEDELKLEAAKRYLSITPVESMMADVTNNMAENMLPEQAEDFKSVMLKHFDLVRLEEIMLKGLINHFSLAELNAIADFYGSEIGKSAMKKLGVYSAEVMPAVQFEVKRAFEKLEEQKAK